MVETTGSSSVSVEEKTIEGRTLYVPPMAYDGAKLISAAMRSIGIDARIFPPADERTLELGAKYTSGDECYPEKVTLGDFMKVVEQPGFKPEKTAFFMPSAGGPCRFGQYASLAEKVLVELGYDDVLILSPTSTNSYDELGENSSEVIRTAWRAVVSSDIVRKLLLKTRPYEVNQGDTEEAYETSLNELEVIFEKKGISDRQRMSQLHDAHLIIRDRFRKIPAKYDPEFPLIGLVGEIFCRLNNFSNENLSKVMEKHGAETWLAGIAEWIWYTNYDQLERLRKAGKRFSTQMAWAKIKNQFQRADEHHLMDIYKEDFKGYEEVDDIKEVLENSRPYLPHYGCLGEMVLSVGGSIYLYEKGVDGIADISPFTCMNGIASEAVFPHVSRDHENIPIR
ncbi:hypothetical protein GF312_19985, partial [Candidatus Poribacteria bacterium]|nr:hypothetical protein [Candidatus Poribacteria bacterium]